MSTILQPALSDLPIIFLNGTVLSFNGSIGYGSQQESTLNIDLIEDCEHIVGGECINEQAIPTSDLIGSPQYFTAGNFTFGGIISSWNKNQSTSGKIFNIKMVDPRQLLENVTLLIDSVRSPLEPSPSSKFSYWISGTLRGINFYNLDEYWEGGLCISAEDSKFTTSRCCSFGRSESNEQGMPYYRVIRGLMGLSGSSHMIIYSQPESQILYTLYVDLLTIPQNLPYYYRIPGPSITLLQLLQDVCDIAGYDFYVYLEKQPDPDPTKPDRNVVKIGLVDLKRPPSSFSTIIDQFNGVASDISFGEELRNDVTRSMVIGEKIHKLIHVDKFLPYFGQDLDPQTKKQRPVVPFHFDTNGFLISKNVDDLNFKLFDPFFEDKALYSIHELDIRCAMASFKSWLLRTMSNDTPGSFNVAIRNQFSLCVNSNPEWIKERLSDPSQFGILNDALAKNLQDLYQNPTPERAASNRPDLLKDLEIIHEWLADLGSNYYGKQYLVPLTNRICVQKVNYTNLTSDLSELLLMPLEILPPLPSNSGDINQEGNAIYSHEPTNAGGWVEPDNEGKTVVLDLPDPELQTFRTDDGRIKCFAIFKTDGDIANAGVT